MPEEQLNIDFGDEELNSPTYEADLEKVDGGTIEGSETTDGTSADDNSAPQVAEPAVPDSAAVVASDPNVVAGQPQQGQPDAPTSTGKTDKDGNLVDGAGNIIAKAGAERRHVERLGAQDKVINTLRGDLQKANDTNAMATALGGEPARLGLDLQETQMGLQTMSSFKKDPVATAKWLLQETMQMGYTLKQILGETADGQLNGGSMDLAAVQGMIKSAIQPLTDDRTATVQTTENNAAAQREYDGFMAKHEDASVHEGDITRMMQADTSLTPEVAYWQLREYAATKGFDFTQPLAPQVQAFRQRANGVQVPAQGNADPQTQTQSQQPMPNGGAPNANLQEGPVMNDAEDPWDVIVKQSLASAGMN